MKSNTNIISWIVVVMAACSLLSMVGTLQIDGIINHQLYQFGLQFDYAWANSYWTVAAFVFAMGWVNIIIAFAFCIDSVILRRRENKEFSDETEEKIVPVKVVEKPEEQLKEKPEEEKAKPAEAEEKTKEPQASVIDTSIKGEEEKPVEVKEVQVQAVTSEAERAEEPENQPGTKPEPAKENKEPLLSESPAQ